jgi:hypothetical protein
MITVMVFHKREDRVSTWTFEDEDETHAWDMARATSFADQVEKTTITTRDGSHTYESGALYVHI